MTVLLIILTIFLLLLTGFLLWYSILCLNKISFITNSLQDLNEDIEVFAVHLKKVYELDMFYGDETLKSLIKHSKLLLGNFEEYKTDFKVFNGEVTIEQLQELERIAEEEEKKREKEKYKIDIQREVDKDEE